MLKTGKLHIVAWGLALFIAALSPTSAAEPVQYRISFPNRAHHEAEVEIAFHGLPPGPLEVRMSRSSPGRYSLHDFARNVYAFTASDDEGGTLKVSRPDPYGWTVSGPRSGDTIRVGYTVYGDFMSGTYSAIDDSHAHLNPPSVFAWARGLGERPIELVIEAPGSEWRVASQLQPTEDPLVYRAPHLQYFLDSPLEIGDFEWVEWVVGEGDEEQTLRIAIHHHGSRDQVVGYAEMAKAVVTQATAVFGELPRFDYKTYTFIADYLPWAKGDAMEHRNSTVLVSSRSLQRSSIALVETLSHEFLHVWNVERIRPATLEPFDFEGGNMSGELFFAEGFTNYYDGLLLARAGHWSFERFVEDLSKTVDRIKNSPAVAQRSPVQMSQLAAFRDGSTWADPQNSRNTFFSYYRYGDAIALALDLSLRSRYDSSLDRLMAEMWHRHGKSERPYSLEDLQTVLAEVSDAAFAEAFFGRHIFGRESHDYEALLEPAALLLRPAHPQRAWIGATPLVFEDRGARLDGPTLIGTPLYEAGLDRGDVLVALDGRRLRRNKSLDRVLDRRQAGEELLAEVVTRSGRRVETLLRLIADPGLEVVTFESAGMTVSEQQSSFRAKWLASGTSGVPGDQ